MRRNSGPFIGAILAAAITQPLLAQSSSSRAIQQSVEAMRQNPDGFCRDTQNGYRISDGVMTSLGDIVGAYYQQGDLLPRARELTGANKPPMQDDSYEGTLRRTSQQSGEQQGTFSATFGGTRALNFDDQRLVLTCRGEVTISEVLWVPVTWHVGFGRPVADALYARNGWFVFNASGADNTVSYANSHPDEAQVIFGPSLKLPFLQASAKVQSDAANAQQQAEAQRQQDAQRAAYANSPAGRADEARRQMQQQAQLNALSADYRRRGLACENSGGTWGYKHGNTVYRMKPGDIPAWYDRDTMACYHL